MIGFMPPAHLVVAVDLVVFTIRADQLHVLLIERGNPPFHGKPALPGGFVRDTENLHAAAERELHEETGLNGHDFHLQQLGAYGEPDRDPRGRIFTVAYLAIVPDLPAPLAGTDASDASWVPVTQAHGLAFDHDQILADALEAARVRLEYTTVATSFCPSEFSVTDLRRVYEVVWGRPIDPRNFHRKVIATEDFVVPSGNKRAAVVGRPAMLYHRGSATRLNPPMLRHSEP
ncbi:NUDIX domain-containing protein [Longispora sp. NPDC051575]|uniref:NUDIX hydrolase n=1 Tax=Longispora sp. NPDC051575 TaxID=3154943 RepID=UPI0034334DE8